jgi:putative FmdB family regulatory protein
MPEYTYQCENCGIQFDIHQDFHDEPLTICPECAEEALHKVYKPARIIFKGKGFYATDNKSSSRKNYLSEVPDSADSSNSESKSEKKEPPKAEQNKNTESKPASKSED